MSRYAARPWAYCWTCDQPMYQINASHTCGQPELCIQCRSPMFTGHDCFARPTHDFRPAT